jgi:hypothetical protein
MMESFRGDMQNAEHHFTEEKVKLETEHANNIIHLRNDVEALKGALVAREHVQALSDLQLSDGFQDLANNIDQIARVRWDKKREAQWPLPESHFLTLEKAKNVNTRKLKQQLIQDIIWKILHENIFHTPFRALGREGVLLESEWTKRFGNGWYDQCPFLFRANPKDPTNQQTSNWPKPTPESERWRYENIKQCAEQLEQSMNDWDPRYKLKKNFEDSLKSTAEQVSQVLESVASVEGSVTKDLSYKAAKLWLEFGSQRCRIFLVMSDSAKNRSQGGRPRGRYEGVQDLVVKPEMRRVGNSYGQELHREEVVSDCEGVYNTIQFG